MKIKHQLLLVSLLLLSLPWAGYLFIHEISLALRQGQSSALTASTHAIAQSLSASSTLNALQPRLNSHGKSIYAIPEEYPQVIDGFYDYENVTLRNIENTGRPDIQVRYQLSHDKDNYYLLVVVSDKHINYVANQSGDSQNGDSLVLLLDQQKGAEIKPVRYDFRTRGPGAIYGQYNDAGQWKQNTAIFGFWQETQSGYNVEIQLSKTVVDNKFAFYLKKQDSKEYISIDGPITKAQLQPYWLVAEDQQLNKKLMPYQRKGFELAVIDKQHWILAQLKQPKTDNESYSEPDNTFWLLEMLYRYLLSNESSDTVQPKQLQGMHHSEELNDALSGKTSQHWYQADSRSNLSILSVAAPLTNDQGELVAALLAHETTDQVQNLTNSAFNRLFLLSFLTLGGAVFALLAYASFLAFRIQRLSKATTEIFAEDGKISANFPQSQAQDEIGELTRNFAELAWRLKEYTEYLQTLSRKLSHELRTPLAIVHSSLDNLKTNLDNNPESNLKSRFEMEQKNTQDNSESIELQDKTGDLTVKQQRKDSNEINEIKKQQQIIYQQRAKEGANRLSRIITAMSEATRVEESIQQHEFLVFDLSKILAELCAAYQDSYNEHNIVFKSEDKSCLITGNPDLIVQMLDKLVDNASDFCPVHGTIELKLKQQGNAVLLTVSNDGPLLPETMKSQLFDSMVSVRNTNNAAKNTTEKNIEVHPANNPTSNNRSTSHNDKIGSDKNDTHLGLGLFVVKLIVEAHGGKIRADNQHDQSGVYFTISLPCSGQRKIASTS